ncbi:mediator of DNA damage checkpoint protein 1 [Hyla sarda]|uniref:mediator of DNA damage checkpoint protein 1 n=1 Tax=Hyla sarda TaxID=327740 RepID=UPI0024C260B9|nr:mediator of DNA damage checkpoint protein 1 [Hyla sarda]
MRSGRGQRAECIGSRGRERQEVSMDATQRLDYSDGEDDTAVNRDRPAGNLHMFAGIHGPARDFPIYYGQNIIGRHASCDITLPAQSVSKKHAILQVRGDCHTICDKGSLNKTRRSKIALAPDVHYALADGDFLLFADVACRYTVHDKVEAETTGVEESEDDSVMVPPTQGALAIEKTPGAAIRRIARGAVLARDSGDEDEEEERQTRRHEGGCGSFKDSFKSSSTGAVFPPDADTIVPESDEEIDTSTSETHLPTLNPPSDSDTDTSRRSSFVPCSQNISTPVVLKDQSKLIARTLTVVDKEEMEPGKPSDAEIKLRLEVEECKKNQEAMVESTSGGIVPVPHVELISTIGDNVKKEPECEKLLQDDALNKPSSEGKPVSSPCGEDENVASPRSETLLEATSESKPKIDASMQHNNEQLSDTGVKPKEENVSADMESDISEDSTKSGIDVKTEETSGIQSNRTGEDSNGGALGSGGAEFHMDGDTDDDEDEAVTTGPDLEKAQTHHVSEMKESENNEKSVTGGNGGGSDSDTDVEDDLNVMKSKSDDEVNKTKDEPSKGEGTAGFGIDSDTDDDDVVDIPKPAESNAELDSKSNTEEKKEEFHADSDTDVEEDVSTAEVKETEPESSKESGKETKDVFNLDSDTDVDEEDDVSSRDVTHGPQDSSASANVKEATGVDSGTDVDEDDQIPGGSSVALEKNSTDEPKVVAKEASALHVDSDTDVDDDDVAPEGTTHNDSAKTGSDVTKAAELHLDSDTDVEEGDAEEAKVDPSSVLENAGEDRKSLSSPNETAAVSEISTEQSKNLPAQIGTEDDETQKSESESIDLDMMPTQCFLEPQEEESELQDEEEATQAFILSSTWAEPDPFKRPADPIGVLQISSVTLNTSEEDIDENAVAETQAFCSEAEPRGPSLQETPEPVDRSVEETVQSSGSGEDSEKEVRQLPDEPISQDATQPVSQCLSGRPPETGTWVHLKREVPASVWIRGIEQEGDSKDLEGDKETSEDDTQAYEQSLNLELEATQSYIDCPPFTTDTPAVPTAEEEYAEPDVPSEKIEQPSSEDTPASESDVTQPYSPSHTVPGVDSGTAQSSASSKETTGDGATRAESIHPAATEDDETQVVTPSVPAAEDVVPETSTKSKEKISLRRGLSRSKRKEEPAQNIPQTSLITEEKTLSIPEEKTLSIPEEKTLSIPEEKTSSRPEEKTSSRPEEKTSSRPEEKTSSRPEEKTSSRPEEKTSSRPEEKTSSTPEEKTSSTPEEKTSSTPEEKTSLTPEEKTSLTPEEKTSLTPEEKTSLTPEEKTSLTPEEKTSLTPEEKTSLTPEEKTSLTPEEKTSLTPEEKTSLTPEEKTSLTPEEKTSLTPEEKTSLTPEEKTSLTPEEKTSLTPEEKTSLTPEEKTSLTTEEKTSSTTEEPLDKGSAGPGSLKDEPDQQSTGKSQPFEPEIKDEQVQKEVRRRGGRRTAASQDKDTAKEEVPVAATSRKRTSKISSEAEPSTSGVSEKRGRRQVPRKGAKKDVNEELEEEHKQSSSNAVEIKESSAPEIPSVNPTEEIESVSSVDDKKSNTVQQISKDSRDQTSLENKEMLCTEAPVSSTNIVSEESMEAKDNSAEKEPDSRQNKKTARNKRRVATRLQNEADKDEGKEENIGDHNLKTSQEKDTSKQSSPLQIQQEESQGRKATRKSRVKPSDEVEDTTGTAEENKKMEEVCQASQVSGNERSRRTRRSLKEDVKEESEKIQEVKGKARKNTSVEDAELKHEDMPESDKRPKRTRKNSKKDTTEPEVKEDGKTEGKESVTKPTRGRKNIKEQQKPEDNIEPQETASSDSQTSKRTRRECRGEDTIVQETVKETTSRRTRRHSMEEEAAKLEDQTKMPRRTRKNSKEETTTKETVDESPEDNKEEAAEGKTTRKTRKNVKDDETSMNETKQTEKNSKSERSSRTRAKASDESKELNEDVEDVNKRAEESPKASPQEETSKPAGGRGRRAAKKEDIPQFSTPVASRKRGQATKAEVEVKRKKSDEGEDEEEPRVVETPKSRRGRPRKQDTQQTPTRKDVTPPDPSPSRNTRQRQSSVLGNSSEPITPRRTNRVSTPAPATRLAQSASAPKILFTGVVDTAGEETIRSLGGDIAKSVFDCTHLVTDRVRRTVKFLCALARGIPIVTLDWIDKCKKSGRFLSPTGFLVHDKEQEKNFNFLLSESLQKAKRSPLFEGYEIHVTANVKPDPDQMKDIISCSGATFLAKMPRTFKEKCVIVSCPEDAARCKSVPSSVPITSAEFILSGILRQEVNPTAYLLSPADTGPTPAKRKR